MKNMLKNFSFPFANQILVFSAIMIFLPFILIGILGPEKIIDIKPQLFRMMMLITTLLAAMGFIYCTLGYHLKINRGDELKLKIHLESLHAAFTATLISFFVLIFVFINFSPVLLNWILVFLAIIAIVVYLVASGIIKDKYQ